MRATRILIIRFSSIGDIVLTTPVIRRLAQQLDGATEIHFLTKKKFASILEANPFVHQIHTIEQSVQEVLPALEALEFDYVIDLHNNIRSRVVKRKLKRLNFTFDKLNIKKWIWVNTGINRMPDVHVVDRYMDTIAAFGTTDDGGGLDYFIPATTDVRKENLPDRFVAFAIGGAHIGKRMEAAKIAAIVREINLPVVLLGGGEDELVAQEIMDQAPNAISSVGKLSLHESALVVKQSELLVCGDTGLMHIASAFQKKIVSLWGCTVPGLGMYPYRPHEASVMIEPHGRKKRPCSKLGNTCKYGKDNRCIQAIDNKEVLEAIEKLLAQ